MMDQRLSILTLGVENLGKSRRFYEGLGWKVATEEQAENIVAFNLQTFVLALYPREKLAKDVGLEMQTNSPPSFTLAYNVATDADVDSVINIARDAGAKIIKTPQKVFWGGYSGYFADYDGYLWEVACSPYTKPSTDGSFQWA